MSTQTGKTTVSPSGTPGYNRPETMSVMAYTHIATKVKEDVNNILEAGWANAQEKRIRGGQIQELLVMSSVVRLQLYASKYGGLSAEQKKTIQPPSVNVQLQNSTEAATEYIRTVLSESKARMLELHNENKSLRRTIKAISKKMKSEPANKEIELPDATALWDNESEMGKILGELDLEDEDDDE